ncbi:MAG TPA: hypothetical protein VJJ28_00005 [Candidatus Paceibacterota bacterium]
MKKKIIILKHNRGELSNQLWNYISVYAYGLEIEAEVCNPSFFEYHRYFNLLKKESFFTKFLSFWFKNHSGRRSSLRNRFWRNIYSLYSKMTIFIKNKSIISSENKNNAVIYLPPTSQSPSLENKSVGYFVGWLFRNPVGIKKFREKLIQSFSPNEKIKRRVDEILEPLRLRYQKIVGVHIRQSDYREFKGGIYFIAQEKIKEIIEEYIKQNKIDRNQTIFLITSDDKIEESIFNNLNIYISKKNAVTDLFILSKTDIIIGSDSSFGAFASWYGNIPHIIISNNPIDWVYYADKKEYFENKYSKTVQY